MMGHKQKLKGDEIDQVYWRDAIYLDRQSHRIKKGMSRRIRRKNKVLTAIV